MSEQEKQTAAEHEDASKESDSLADAASNTENEGGEKETIDIDSEESDNGLDVDQELSENNQGKVDVATEQREKQVSTWEERLMNGEVERKEIPKWVLKRIDYKDNEPDMDAQIDEKLDARLEAKEDARKAAKIKKQLKDITVTKTQKAKLMDRYKSLKAKFPESQALEIAMEAAGITLEATTKKPKATMPPGGKGETPNEKISTKNKTWKQVQETHSEEERRKHLIEKSNEVDEGM